VAGRLTNRQRVFVEEYLQCWCASEAARRAGYRGDANTVGPRLLANVGVKALIEQRIADKAMSADEVLVRLTEQARGDFGDFIRINELTGEAFLDLAAAKVAGKLHLVKSYQEASEKFGAKLELYDAQAALVHLGKHHRLFAEVLNINNLDWSKLTDEQIQRLAGGEDPLKVLTESHTDQGAGRDGAPETAGDG
jgi:phage terminase small subunit